MNVELKIQLSDGKTETFVTPPDKVEATDLGLEVHREGTIETYGPGEIDEIRLRWTARKPQAVSLINDYV